MEQIVLKKKNNGLNSLMKPIMLIYLKKNIKINF